MLGNIFSFQGLGSDAGLRGQWAHAVAGMTPASAQQACHLWKWALWWQVALKLTNDFFPPSHEGLSVTAKNSWRYPPNGIGKAHAAVFQDVWCNIAYKRHYGKCSAVLVKMLLLKSAKSGVEIHVLKMSCECMWIVLWHCHNIILWHHWHDQKVERRDWCHWSGKLLTLLLAT